MDDFYVARGCFFLISLTYSGFIRQGTRPRFTLQTILLVTGLIACAIVLTMTGDPWKVVRRFPGYEANIAISSDGELVAMSQGLSIVIQETKNRANSSNDQNERVRSREKGKPALDIQNGVHNR